MINVTDFQEGLTQLQQAPIAIAYISMPNCSVCVAVKPQLLEHLGPTGIPLLHFDAATLPEVAGTFQVLTAPAILLFVQGKEVDRQARFIDFTRLETTVKNYLAAGSAPVDYAALFASDE